MVAYLSDFYGPPEAYSLNYYDENNMFQRKLTDSIDAFIELDASSQVPVGIRLTAKFRLGNSRIIRLRRNSR